MAKLIVPPLDESFQKTLLLVIANKKLEDDGIWTVDILPGLVQRLREIETAVRQAQTANANTPNASTVAEITATCAKINRHLAENFANGAPFTIHRIAELMLHYASSGYSLSSVVLAQKYLDALARTVVVLSKETDHIQNLETSSGQGNGWTKRLREEGTPRATPEDYDEHDLPTNIRFVALPWAKNAVAVQDFDVEGSVCDIRSDGETPPPKRRKGREDGVENPNQLLSPLQMDAKEAVEESNEMLKNLGEFCQDKYNRSERLSEEVLF